MYFTHKESYVKILLLYKNALEICLALSEMRHIQTEYANVQHRNVQRMRQTQTRYANVQHRNVQRNVRQDGIWKKRRKQ